MSVNLSQWNGQSFGTISSVSLSSSANYGVVTYPFTIEADNTEGTLQVNSYVDYNLTASQSDNCLALPIQAVRTVGLEDGTSATVVYVQADSEPDNMVQIPYMDEEIPAGFYPVQVEIGIQDRALDGVSLTIDRGEFVAIVGQSGSGKSTMMNVLGCLDVPTYGEYLLDGTDVSELSDTQLSRIRNKEIGFIFQQYNLIQTLSVQENVELPLVYQGFGIDARHELAIEALELVGFVDRRKNTPTQMSGGQQQRVAIARAISTHPPIIMADEPTGALDSKTGLEVLKFLQQLNKEGSTVILITHDNGIAATARRCVRLADGKIIEDHEQEVDWL